MKHAVQEIVPKGGHGPVNMTLLPAAMTKIADERAIAVEALAAMPLGFPGMGLDGPCGHSASYRFPKAFNRIHHVAPPPP
jgi:hypothetical protein